MKTIRIDASSMRKEQMNVAVDQAIADGARLVHCVGVTPAHHEAMSARCYEARVGIQFDDYPPEFRVNGCTSTPIFSGEHT